MYISEIVEINNYRNLTGKIITFNDTLNFLIGENNIGKTNILELINICFAIGKFAETDFMDITLPIKIKFKVKYSNEEIGYFEDNFDVDDSNSITLVAMQDSVDERINYYHDTPNQTKISMATIRTMNILYYYAQRMPSKEVDFRKTSGSGKVLNYLIQHSLEQSEIQEKDILKKTKLKNIVKNVNRQIKKINTITGDSVSAYVDTEVDKLVCRLLGLGDESGRELSSLGEGVQYAFNILLQILDDGRLTDSKGRMVDFKNTILIMTSNVGATKINKKNHQVLGFGTNKDKEEETKDQYDKMKESIMGELKQKFKPEFLNRIDDIIVFHPLEEYHIYEIVKLMTREVIERLKSLNIDLKMNEEAEKLIAQEGMDLEYGARPLKRAIQKELEDTLSEAILKGDIKKGSSVVAEIEDNKIVYKCKVL